jgi:hypothetical protein
MRYLAILAFTLFLSGCPWFKEPPTKNGKVEKIKDDPFLDTYCAFNVLDFWCSVVD